MAGIGSGGDRPVLVVGAGFAGAVYARTLADAGWRVHVIDRRGHIGGNAYDERMHDGVLVHRYGPHLFHTNMANVVAWVGRFGKFIPYEHRVEALLSGGTCAPLPINRRTVNMVFDVALRTPDAVEAFLAEQAVPCASPRNAADYLGSRIGRQLTDLFFRTYTRKMWGLDLEDIDADVIKRIPLRFDDEERYFPSDTFQLLPANGYTALFAGILDHERIKVTLGTAFEHGMEADYVHCFNSMAIDEYFGESLGPLPYRSIRFYHRDESVRYRLGTAAVINFTDDGKFTRETDWSLLPAHAGAGLTKTVTREEPCDFRDNHNERYYPIKTSDGRNEATYRRYRTLAAREPAMTFIGRCGTYQYLDMHQVISQSISGVRAWLTASGMSEVGGR